MLSLYPSFQYTILTFFKLLHFLYIPLLTCFIYDIFLFISSIVNVYLVISLSILSVIKKTSSRYLPVLYYVSFYLFYIKYSLCFKSILLIHCVLFTEFTSK